MLPSGREAASSAAHAAGRKLDRSICKFACSLLYRLVVRMLKDLVYGIFDSALPRQVFVDLQPTKLEWTPVRQGNEKPGLASQRSRPTTPPYLRECRIIEEAEAPNRNGTTDTAGGCSETGGTSSDSTQCRTTRGAHWFRAAGISSANTAGAR